MKADNAVDPVETQFMAQDFEKEQKKLSKPYDVSSKLAIIYISAYSNSNSAKPPKGFKLCGYS
jgi:hypothetical protein|tara:strand:- start:1609 stop:1797 length:189 start_codon:yes stop_codon:yes gene_type:complete